MFFSCSQRAQMFSANRVHPNWWFSRSWAPAPGFCLISAAWLLPARVCIGELLFSFSQAPLLEVVLVKNKITGKKASCPLCLASIWSQHFPSARHFSREQNPHDVLVPFLILVSFIWPHQRGSSLQTRQEPLLLPSSLHLLWFIQIETKWSS